MAVKRAADSVVKMVVLKAVRMADHWVFQSVYWMVEWWDFLTVVKRAVQLELHWVDWWD
jgi:hypothetical protein